MSQLTLNNKTYAVKGGGQIRLKGIVRNYTEQEIADNKNGVAEFLLTLPKQSFLEEIGTNPKTEKPKK